MKDHCHENAKRIALQLVKETDEATGVKSDKGLFDKYYDQTCREINHKVKELQWDKRRFEVDLFMLSKRELSDEVKLAWTEEMIEYFAKRCEEIIDDEKNGHYTDDDAYNMEEVDDDTSGSANFISQNEVVNGIDTSMAQMQGDFNVTLNVEECSNSFGVIDKDMDVFRKVLSDLCLDDIISFGMFYTWTQKRMNPESGSLKKLDRVLGNPSFLTCYGSCFAKFLPYMTSDHSPTVIVYPDIKSAKPKSFRFMNFLADKPDFLATVKKN
ncbi:ribonuclease H-like domain-containing protein [Tanacetum coccineum]|uniref:Ribonuclease H-like domain-containing protein n=1 Tax=Tanacetum coccineum TaxID=301880 RepID=A0ABQ5HX61_9ASTR